MALPLIYMGLCTATDRAGPAFIAAVLATRMHHTLAIEEFMHTLRPFCVGAYNITTLDPLFRML